MKNYSLLLTSFFIGIIFIGCTKQPSASFTTDKQEYIAGETVQLTNTSTDAHEYEWTMPDQQTITSTNATYTIDRNMGFNSLKFQLEADSKHDRKSSDITKSVSVIPASVFSVDSTNFTYYPINVNAYLFNNNWLINSSVKPYLPQGLSYWDADAFLAIELPSASAPTIGSAYILQANDTLTSGHAYVYLKRNWWEDNWEDFTSLSGQLNITITNGKIHAVFNHILAKHTNSLGTIMPNEYISGDITCH